MLSLLRRCLLLCFLLPLCAVALEAATWFDIPAQSLPEALRLFASQAKMQLIYKPDAVREGTSNAVVGEFDTRVALEKLLLDKGFEVVFVAKNAATIRPAQSAAKAATTAATTAQVSEAEQGIWVAQTDGPSPSQGEGGLKPAEDQSATIPSSEAVGPDNSVDRRGIPEILVKGSRSLDLDIQRTRDDIQPYVVFSAEQIEQSQASSVEEFLRTRLPMNTQQGTASQQIFGNGDNRSVFNLRGLGANQTLILVDGRKLPTTYGTDSLGNYQFNQPDLNGIPVEAIERIEILPATASGIYGGGATGGVINVILKRNYTGAQLKTTYGSAFSGGAAYRKIEGNMAFELEGGRAHVMVTASHTDSGRLLSGERDFDARARALEFANNPASFTSLFNPPAGYTSNLCSGTDFFFGGQGFGFCDGAPLTFKTGAALGSSITSVPLGYLGTSTDQGAALAANAGKYNLAPSNDSLGRRYDLLAVPKIDWVSISPRRAFGEYVEVYADLSWNRSRSESSVSGGLGSAVAIAASAPNNPFTTDILVTAPNVGLALLNTVDDKTLRATGGALVHLPHAWSASLDYVWGRVKSLQILPEFSLGAAGLAALGNGTLDITRDLNAYPLDYAPYLLSQPNFIRPTQLTSKDAPLRLSGPLFKLPAGPVMLSGLIEYHQDSAADSFVTGVDAVAYTPITQFVAQRSQTVYSYGAELRAPLVSAVNALPWAESLDLQFNLRRDDYETRSVSSEIILPSPESPLPPLDYSTNRVSATKYTAGLRYSPVKDVTLRASIGNGFLPPNIGQIIAGIPQVIPIDSYYPIPDPKRGGTINTGDVTFVSGGNPSLKSEDSESFSAGMILTPRFAPGWRLSVDYTRIKKTNEIATPDLVALLDNESVFPGRVTRGPNLPGDQPGWGGPITTLDDTLINIAATQMEAYDLQIDYDWQSGRWGDLHFYAVATRESQFARSLAPGLPSIDTVGLLDGPLIWKGNLGLDWRKGPWMLAWNAQYYGSYHSYNSTDTPDIEALNILNQGSANIPSQMYHDVTLGYRFDRVAGVLQGCELQVGIQNVFNSSPPIVATTGLIGGYSTYGDPRLRRFSLSVAKHFNLSH